MTPTCVGAATQGRNQRRKVRTRRGEAEESRRWWGYEVERMAVRGRRTDREPCLGVIVRAEVMMKQPGTPPCHDDKSSVWLGSTCTETYPLMPLCSPERIIFPLQPCLSEMIKGYSSVYRMTPKNTFTEANEEEFDISDVSLSLLSHCRYSVKWSFCGTACLLIFGSVWQIKSRMKLSLCCALISKCLPFVCIFSIYKW